MTTVVSLLSALAAVVGGYFAWKTNPNRLRRQAEKDLERKQARAEKEKDAIRRAVYGGADDKLNEIVARLLAPALLGLLVLAGCIQAKTVYIPTDRRIESCTNSLGIACKAVPDAVMVEMLEKLQELKDLKNYITVNNNLRKEQP